MNWLQKTSQSQISIDLGNYPQNVSTYLHDLAERSMQRDPKDPYTHEDAEESATQLIQQTQQNMQKVVQMIEQAISRIPYWNSSPIVVKCGSPPEEWSFGPNYFEPVKDAHIQVGTKQGWSSAPDFTLFVHDDEILIDDILDAGDEDFFVNKNTGQDYFSLIQQLRNPDINQKSKVLTLYTARPVKDRDIYYDAQSIPSNLFLTSNYGRARGIALELGRGGIRDVWKVRIEEKYLINTLDAATAKDYQVVGQGPVPVKSIRLIDPGE